MQFELQIRNFDIIFRYIDNNYKLDLKSEPKYLTQ